MKSALVKQAWESPSPLLRGESALKTILLWTRKWFLTSHGICIHLDLGLLSTYNWLRSKFLLFLSHLVCDYFVRGTWMDWDSHRRAEIKVGTLIVFQTPALSLVFAVRQEEAMIWSLPTIAELTQGGSCHFNVIQGLECPAGQAPRQQTGMTGRQRH